MTNKSRTQQVDDHPDEKVKVVTDTDSTRRSESSLNSQGKDERGNYAKSHSNPDRSDSYKSRAPKK